MTLYSSGSVLDKSSSRVSARSIAMFFNVRFLVLIPKASAMERTLYSPMIGRSSLPWAAHFNIKSNSLACIPCWAAPAAAPRRRFLATIKSASAPQTPRGDFGVILQGPMLQIRQQVPLKPKVHWGCCLSKRSNAVSYPSCSIRSIISFTAGSGTLSSTSCLVGKVLR